MKENPGNCISTKSFWSTTADKKRCERFEGDIFYRITVPRSYVNHCQGFADISTYAKKTEEKEVLLLPFNNFIIKTVTRLYNDPKYRYEVDLILIGSSLPRILKG